MHQIPTDLECSKKIFLILDKYYTCEENFCLLFYTSNFWTKNFLGKSADIIEIEDYPMQEHSSDLIILFLVVRLSHVTKVSG